MISGTLDSWERNKTQYGDAVRRALAFVSSLNTDDMQPTVEIDGKRMYVMRQTVDTVNPAERLAEAHSQYADIHLVLEGEELQGYAPLSDSCRPVEDRLEQNDYALFERVDGEQFILLKPGSFTVYWPGEFHRPNCSEKGQTQVVKLVVKIHRDLFM